MKTFEAPTMSIIRLSSNNILATSASCDTNVCMGFDCPDCPTICTGIYHCDVFKSATYGDIF